MLSKFKKTPHFNNFLMSLKILKKIEKDEVMFKRWQKVAEAMRKNETNLKMLTTGEALEKINSTLSVENILTLSDLKSAVTKKIIHADVVEIGRDSIGRRITEWNIPEIEIENYIGIMQLFEAGEHFEHFKKSIHPRSGDEIVEYQTLSSRKNGISKVEIKFDVALRLLQKEEFRTFLNDFAKNNKV